MAGLIQVWNCWYYTAAERRWKGNLAVRDGFLGRVAIETAMARGR